MKVEYDRKALKALRGMDRRTAQRLVGKINQLAEKPQTLKANIKPLSNLDGSRLRVGGYRVIFTVRKDTLYIVKIGGRKDVYKP